MADRCEVQLAYAIGLADPVSVSVNTFGTGMIRDETLAVWLENHVDMRPGVVIRRFGLTRPIYRGLAAYGPFGENGPGDAVGADGSALPGAVLTCILQNLNRRKKVRCEIQ